MRKFEILNSKEKKKTFKVINERFGSDFKTEKAVIRVNKRLFLINGKIEELEFTRLRIERFGLYLATSDNRVRNKNNIRLSIEGSQIIGEIANKNIISLDAGQIKKWLSGEDFMVKTSQINNCNPGFVIIKFNNNFFGCGVLKKNRNEKERKDKESKEEYEIKNYIPKERRLKSFLM